MTFEQLINAGVLVALLLLIVLYVSGRLSLRAKKKAAAVAKRSCHFCTNFDARKKLPEAALQPGLVYAEHTVQALEQPMEETDCGMRAVGEPIPLGSPRTVELVSDFWSARRKKMKILGSVQEIGYCALHCRRVARNNSCDQYAAPADGE